MADGIDRAVQGALLGPPAFLEEMSLHRQVAHQTRRPDAEQT